MQSLHAGHDEVAHESHDAFAEHDPDFMGSHVAAHFPLEKMQTSSPSQSSCEEQLG